MLALFRQGSPKCGLQPQRRIAGGTFGGTFERLYSICLNLLCLLSDMNPSLRQHSCKLLIISDKTSRMRTL